MFTLHSHERVATRIKEAGVDEETVIAKARFETTLCSSRESIAVRILVLPNQVGESWGNESNGDEVWVIIRQKDIVTMMLRRKTQPKTTIALRVDRVVVR